MELLDNMFNKNNAYLYPGRECCILPLKDTIQQVGLWTNGGESYTKLGWLMRPVIPGKTMYYILCANQQMVTKVKQGEKLCLGSTLLSQTPIWQAVSSFWQRCIVVKERITHPE